MDNKNKRNIPLIAHWDITRRCNFRCIFCITSSGRVSDNELTTHEVCGLIDKLYNSGILFLTILGGEPFYRDDIIVIFKYAISKKMFVSFSTNGSLITDDHAKELFAMKKSFRCIQFSLYGYDNESYGAVTGRRENYNTSITGIKKLIDMGMHVTALVVVTPDNFEKLFEYCNAAKNIGIKKINFTVISNIGRGEYLYDKKQFIDIYHLLFDELIKLDKKINNDFIEIAVEARPFLREHIESDIVNIKFYHQNCKAASTSIYINPEGLAAPCPFIEHNSQEVKNLYPELFFDDLKTKDFLDIWNNKAFNAMRYFSNPENSKFHINTNCSHFNKKTCIPCTTTPCQCLSFLKSIIESKGTN